MSATRRLWRKPNVFSPVADRSKASPQSAGWEFLNQPGAPVFTIAPRHDFLAAVADALYDPEATDIVADSLVLVPNRRAARTLGEALVTASQHHGRSGIVLPTIVPLGEIGLSDDFGDFDTASPMPADERRGVLVRLIRHWHERVYGDEAGLPPVQALRWADDVAALLDQGDLAGGCDWSRLDRLIDDADLAMHWQDGARFLRLVLGEAWPAYLAETGRCSLATRRLEAVTALTERWHSTPPSAPVWIVGSTGATPVDRKLMRAVIDLPLGAILFRGLDTDASDADWDHISLSPGHPQYAIKRTMDHLDVVPRDIRPWPGAGENDAARARRRLLYEALAPAAATRDWSNRLAILARDEQYTDPGQFTRRAVRGLRLIEADDDTDQAMIASLALREAAQDPGRTAALVTPDRVLGRRVSHLLKRWGIEIGPSEGIPFSQTSAGRLLIATVEAARDPADPIALLALVKQDAARFGRTRDALYEAVTELELARESDGKHLLRGPRRHGNLEDLTARLDDCGAQRAFDLLRDIGSALDPLRAAISSDPVQPDTAVDALSVSLKAVGATPTDDAVLDDEDMSGALDRLAGIARGVGPIPERHWPDLVRASLGEHRIRAIGELPRLAIWGPLEARLQHRDLMILAGLNEKQWPRAAPIDGLLPSRLRAGLGLPDTEEILGLSAYDFSQLACGSEVLLLRPVTSSRTRCVASRWLWRLRKLCEAGVGEGATEALTPASARSLHGWARYWRTPKRPPRPTSRPEPRPPLSARPKNISVSTARALLTDPYAAYARSILRLNALPAPGMPADARLVGIAIHEALDTYQDGNRPLIDLIKAELAKAGMTRANWSAVAPLWERAASDFRGWDASRRKEVERVHTETSGSIVLYDDITLRARADRVEECRDGTLAIIDVKTGKPPGEDEVISGDQPQLPLEALIAARGGFDGIDAKPVSALIYYRMGMARPAPGNGQPLGIDPTEAAEKTEALLLEMLARFAEADHPYAPRLEDGQYASDYDRLSRRAEWSNR